MDKNIYKGLECRCSGFEKIPINRRELGVAVEVSSYTLSIAALGDLWCISKAICHKGRHK